MVGGGGGSLVDLNKHQLFAKLQPSKLVVTIHFRQIFLPKSLSIQIRQTLLPPNFPTKQYMSALKST